MFLETSRGKYVGFILALGVTDLFEVTRGHLRSLEAGGTNINVPHFYGTMRIEN